MLIIESAGGPGLILYIPFRLLLSLLRIQFLAGD
jgi:hypothetical protein